MCERERESLCVRVSRFFVSVCVREREREFVCVRFKILCVCVCIKILCECVCSQSNTHEMFIAQ